MLQIHGSLIFSLTMKWTFIIVCFLFACCSCVTEYNWRARWHKQHTQQATVNYGAVVPLRGFGDTTKLENEIQLACEPTESWKIELQPCKICQNVSTGPNPGLIEINDTFVTGLNGIKCWPLMHGSSKWQSCIGCLYANYELLSMFSAASYSLLLEFQAYPWIWWWILGSHQFMRCLLVHIVHYMLQWANGLSQHLWSLWIICLCK